MPFSWCRSTHTIRPRSKFGCETELLLDLAEASLDRKKTRPVWTSTVKSQNRRILPWALGVRKSSNVIVPHPMDRKWCSSFVSLPFWACCWILSVSSLQMLSQSTALRLVKPHAIQMNKAQVRFAKNWCFFAWTFAPALQALETFKCLAHLLSQMLNHSEDSKPTGGFTEMAKRLWNGFFLGFVIVTVKTQHPSFFIFFNDTSASEDWRPPWPGDVFVCKILHASAGKSRKEPLFLGWCFYPMKQIYSAGSTAEIKFQWFTSFAPQFVAFKMETAG